MGSFSYKEDDWAYKRSYTAFVGSIVLVCFLAVILFSVYRNVLTGHASASLNLDSLVAGKTVTGTVAYGLSGSEILPVDSTLTLDFNSYVKSLPLASALADPSVLDNVETISFNPDLEVTVLLTETSSSGGGGGGNIVEVQPGSAPPSSSQTVPGPFLAIAPIVEERKYTVKAGSEVVANIPSKRTASIKEVTLNGASIGSSSVKLVQTGTSIKLSTSYTRQVKGFTSKISQVVFDVSKFKLSVPLGTKLVKMTATFDYSGDVLAEQVQTLSVDDGNVAGSSGQNEINSANNPDSPSQQASAGSAGSSGQQSTNVDSQGALPQDCDNPSCTDFGSCTIPSLGQGRAGMAPGSPIKVRQCVCPDGNSYTESESCTEGDQSEGGITVNPIGGSSDVGLPGRGRSGTDRTVVGGGGGGQDKSGAERWKNSYRFDETSVDLTGGITKGLAENENIILPIAGESHTIGILKLDSYRSNPRVLVQVSSQPFSFYLSLGETREVDVGKDGVADVAVTFSSIGGGGKAILNVRPYDAPSFSNTISPDEKAVTLVKVSTGLPVAHVILNNKLPALRVFLVQSGASLPAHCYNTIRDFDELGIDCGGSCNACIAEKNHYETIISWAVVAFLFAFLAFLSRKVDY